MITFEIEDKKYEIVGNICINNKKYIAYSADDIIYINAYTLEENRLNLLTITEEEKELVRKELEL